MNMSPLCSSRSHLSFISAKGEEHSAFLSRTWKSSVNDGSFFTNLTIPLDDLRVGTLSAETISSLTRESTICLFMILAIGRVSLDDHTANELLRLRGILRLYHALPFTR
jgi:hypothetical protein